MNQNQLTEFAGRYVYLCEDSTEGIFTAVYDAFADGHRKEDTVLRLADSTYTVFCLRGSIRKMRSFPILRIISQIAFRRKTG